MERWSGRTAVVTGASAGIGAAIAVRLANSGLTVVGLARRPKLVDELKSKVTGKGSIHSRQCDVSNSDEVAAAFRWVEDIFGGTDILVNNAAVLYQGHITDLGAHTLSEQQIMSVIDINVKGFILCARHAVTSMKTRGYDGHIVNINSIAGHYIPSTTIMNVYPSTKHATTAFTACLNAELVEADSNIKISSISPGLVDTEMVRAQTPESQTVMDSAPKLRPADVAEAVLYAISTPSTVNISELTITPVRERKF